MRKRIGIILACIFCLGMIVCGCSSKEKEEEIQYADKAFVEDMAKGLQARWDLNEKDEKKEGYKDILVDSEENKDMMITYIDAELNIIEKYKDEKFEDSNLQEIAIKYINLLSQHKKLCDYITVDYEKYYEEFQPIYNERSKVINTLVNDYEMTVDKKHQNTLNEFQTNSKLVEEKETQEKAISKMLENVQFQEVSDDGSGYKTYQAVVENTTDIDFKNFNVSINLLDKDDVIVETTYDQVTAFNKGAKVRFEFMTDKEFESTQVMVDYWE